MDPLAYSESDRSPERDVEKQGELKESSINVISSGSASPERNGTVPNPTLFKGRLARWNDKIEGLGGLEARGIARVLPKDQQDKGLMGYLQMINLWMGIDLNIPNAVPGLLGPLLFKLGWVDSICCVIFGNALSCCGTAYMATFGAESGNRTMIINRYFMGYWPSKLISCFNILNQLGWGIAGSIIAGQAFSAVSGGSLSIAVGCAISALSIGTSRVASSVAHQGTKSRLRWARYAWIPQLFAFCVLVGSARSHFDTSLESMGPSGTVTANRCSFFALQYSVVIGFSAAGADFSVYFAKTTSKRLTFLSTWVGQWLPVMFINIISVGIATGIASTPAWREAYDISSGALLLACYDGLGGFGSFCVVILALGSIANNAPGTYSAALSLQVLGRYGKAVPRWLWCFLIMILEIICSVVGRNHVYDIFENMLPLIGVYVSPWLAIVVTEHLLFHVLRRVPFDWSAWEDRKRLPVGLAALAAYLIGWAGAIIGMYRVWWHGPVALKIGNSGGDIGAWMAIAFTSLTYPPLRLMELRYIGR
ncbi:MAG: hypothetical protein LQ344_007419 [Seirophora lacunosa]|nr:MAG: hypothetical protein LQ344_007419 [Seirophora lacunosa]